MTGLSDTCLHTDATANASSAYLCKTLTWASRAVARACGGVVTQPSRRLGWGEATSLQRAKGAKVEACQRGSEGGVVHIWVAPAWSAKAKGRASGGTHSWGAPSYHALLHQTQVILPTQEKWGKNDYQQCRSCHDSKQQALMLAQAVWH